MPSLKKHVESLAQHAHEAQKQYQEALDTLQRICSHPVIVRAESHIDMLQSLPPFFVCKNCGYAEESWGAGPVFLKPYRSYLMHDSRENASQLIVGKLLSNPEAVERARAMNFDGWRRT